MSVAHGTVDERDQPQMLADLLNKDVLVELAGERAFERGTDYFADGHVVGLKEEGAVITARVRGTYYYGVKIWAEDEELASRCNCPVGQDGVFCKHCVAVGLAWLDRQKSKVAGRRRRKRNVSDEEIQAYLLTQDKPKLVELLMDHAEWDSDFRDRLVLSTVQRGGKSPDLAAFRGAIEKAIRHRGFVHYRQMPEYARRIEAVVDSLGNLLKRGCARGVRELTEHALKQMDTAMNGVDDSDGFMGGILDTLQDLHRSACQAVKPEPEALAKFLFESELGSGWEVFLGAAETYAGVLGKAGLAEYHRLAESNWAKVPPVAPGEEDPERHGKRWRITHIMETLAKQTGDVEALVAVKTRDLSQAFSFLEIAQIYKAAGNDEDALEWAERGVRAFPVHTDGRLRDFLINEYHQRGRHDEAIATAWSSFREHPRLDEYQRLHHSALCAKQWSHWRERALALLREEIGAQKTQSSKDRWDLHTGGDHSNLVEIYLWEGDTEAAWAAAQNGGCCDALWSRLAEARGKDHPEDALAVYREQLKSALQWAQQSAYEDAVGILHEIEKLMMRTGRKDEFAFMVQSIRAQYKPRRNLIKLLDARGWS